MRTETGKMPASFIFPIGNRPGESDDRFGFIWYGCWMRWHSELSFGTMEALALRSACAIAAALQRRLASPKPLRLGHAQAREAAWHGARLNRGCGCAEAPPSRPCPSKGNGLTWHSTQSGLWLCARQRRCKSRPWPNLFGNGRNAARFRCNQSSSKVGFAEAPPSRPCPSKGKRLDMALDSIGALALRSACAIAAALQRR